jgi:alpha-N-arabinofuranosidase
MKQQTTGRMVRGACAALASLMLSASAWAQQPVPVTIKVDQPGARIDPIFYGFMTEEINFSYDGGLYAELIRNRIFQDPLPGAGRGNRGGQPPAEPESGAATIPNWSSVTSGNAAGSIAIDTNDPVNTVALTRSLKVTIDNVASGGRVGAANSGYWGIPVRPNTTYKASFYAKGSSDFTGPLTLTIESNDGKTTYASATVPGITTQWKKFEVPISIAAAPETADTRFVISAGSKGTFWLSLVSLFPPTYKNRPNGNRVDLSELLADLKPSFLRFPGGNYLEGPNYENRFNWKATIGPLEERPGHMSPWNYRSSDGMGLLEFLGWCEDLNMEPIVGVYAGLHIDRGQNILTGDRLKPHVQDALDEIEYITGDVTTTWGARRAKDGHPAPFKLRYVEVGNEDWLNNGTPTYDERFTMFYDAIKAKYPDIKVISSISSNRRYPTSRTPDLFDDHFYVSIPAALRNAHLYDKYDRSRPKVFVGEWATNSPRSGPTGHHAFALGDAAWLTGLERNADVINMHCYAPLLVNVNPGGMQWQVNLIGYDALKSFGSPAYFVQRMFSANRGDVVLPTTVGEMPLLNSSQLPSGPASQGRRGGRGGGAPATNPAPAAAAAPSTQPGEFESIYASATRENASGDVILKLVNIQASAQPIAIDLQGVSSVNPTAAGEVLAAAPDQFNSVERPTNVAPKPVTVNSVAPKFTYDAPAHSVTVLRVKTK